MEPVKVGKHFFNAHPTTVTQVFSPEENKEGVYLRTATICTGGGIINLYSGPKAPARLGDMTVHAIMVGPTNQSGTTNVSNAIQIGINAAKQTGGRYESIAAATRLGTLLPENISGTHTKS